MGLGPSLPSPRAGSCSGSYGTLAVMAGGVGQDNKQLDEVLVLGGSQAGWAKLNGQDGQAVQHRSAGVVAGG